MALAASPDLAAEEPKGDGRGRHSAVGGEKSAVSNLVMTGPLPLAARLSPLPESFGDYELLEEIGRGGMGVVYRARQRSLDRVVAIKMTAFAPDSSPELVKRFRAEAVSAASLHHPNVVAIHEVGVHEGRHFFVMDYVQRLSQSPALNGISPSMPVTLRGIERDPALRNVSFGAVPEVPSPKFHAWTPGRHLRPLALGGQHRPAVVGEQDLAPARGLGSKIPGLEVAQDVG